MVVLATIKLNERRSYVRPKDLPRIGNGPDDSFLLAKILHYSVKTRRCDTAVQPSRFCGSSRTPNIAQWQSPSVQPIRYSICHPCSISDAVSFFQIAAGSQPAFDSTTHLRTLDPVGIVEPPSLLSSDRTACLRVTNAPLAFPVPGIGESAGEISNPVNSCKDSQGQRHRALSRSESKCRDPVLCPNFRSNCKAVHAIRDEEPRSFQA